MRSKFIGIGFVLSLVMLLSAAAANAQNPMKNISVSGTNITNATLDITSFAVKKGGVVANGVLKGTVNGQQVTQNVTLPVTPGQHSCQILKLDLGPLNLDILGLQVALSAVHLEVNAQPGSGNLLGNLLCDIAHLLDGNGNAFGRLAGLLNDLLKALG